MGDFDAAALVKPALAALAGALAGAILFSITGAPLGRDGLVLAAIIGACVGIPGRVVGEPGLPLALVCGFLALAAFLLLVVGYPAEDCTVPEAALVKKPLEEILVWDR